MDSQLIRQGMCSLSLGLATLIGSLALGFTSPALPSMENDPDFEITSDQGSWIGAVVPGAALLGSLVAAPLIDSFGRQKLMLWSTLMFMVSWVGISASGTVLSVVFFRIVGGLSLGVQAVAGSVYQSEVIHVDLRPKLGLLPTLFGTFGLLLINVAGQMFEWRALALLGAISCIPLFLLYIYLPETPYFLIKVGKREEALKVLTWLRASDFSARKELKEYEVSDKESDSNISFTDAFKEPFRWGVGVSLLLHVVQQTTGINAIIFFSSRIFEATGSSINAGTCSVIITVVNIISTIISLPIIGGKKRRNIMAFSSKYIIISLIMLSSYLYIRDSGVIVSNDSQLNTVLGVIPLLCIVLYIFSFALGWGPIPWLFIGEGLSSEVRGLGSSLAIAANWTFAFIITKSFSWLEGSMGLAFIFLAYGFMTALGQVLLSRYMPETLNLSPIQVDRFYKDSCKKKDL